MSNNQNQGASIEAERALFEAEMRKQYGAEHFVKVEDPFDGIGYTSQSMNGAFNGWLAARRTPVADGAAVDLPPMPEPRIVRECNPGETDIAYALYITSCDAWNHCLSKCQEAISHYLRKQAGQVESVGTKMAAWLYGLSKSALPYESWAKKCADLSDEWDKVVSQEGEQPTINKGEN